MKSPAFSCCASGRFDFATQGLIASAGFLKHCYPAALLGVEGLVKNALDFPPAVRFHFSCYSFRGKPGFRKPPVASHRFQKPRGGRGRPAVAGTLSQFRSLFLAPPDVLFEIISGSVTGFGGSCGQIWTNKSKNIAYVQAVKAEAGFYSSVPFTFAPKTPTIALSNGREPANWRIHSGSGHSPLL
jgi:hypothetical protein